ncbi:uncharacterized protein YndB with AHSA1/START domain [Herbihabitans rhizosphaerae]|uniref:Uncharacterized protein YndB with AHSA1/START domain n=1 Tax=Herbihabitans rhizosphaerae TaxID=1872711 RepID=A0A4Q7KBR4_9PSEU|nr:SRPBCC domain-containing protein [Herbihabitans rhizosphaerae]RZS29682.1 uncharacterized protein YndB with AHSA1/START domain [Herbihabitans rhizosphaerae]
MSHEFSDAFELQVDADPDTVWDAIATGPGIDSWFMGRTEVDGAAVRTAFGDFTPEHPVTAWEPGARLAYGGEPAPDGRRVGYEFLIEGREGGSTVLRVVTGGFLPGDDWADEYEAMTLGHAMFFRTLREYLGHFAPRSGSPFTVFGPQVSTWDSAWTALRNALGSDDLDGQVYYTNAHTIGVRTDDALLRFLQGFQGGFVLTHSVFSDIDVTATERAWQSWIDTLTAKG